MEASLTAQVVRAGAGTGKTECLVNEVYRIFKEYRALKARSPRLIVCTFTRKASQEMKERLLKKAVAELEEIGQPAPKGEYPPRENTEGKNTEGKNTERESSSLFLSYIQSPSLYVSTIDGILNTFVKRYGYKLGLSPDFQLSHSRINEALFDSLAEEFIFRERFSLLKKIPYPFLRDLFLFYVECRLKYGEVSFYTEEDFEKFQLDKQNFADMESLFGAIKKQKPDRAKLERYFKKRESLVAPLFNSGYDIGEIKPLFKEEESFQPERFIPLFQEFQTAGEEFFLKFMKRKRQSALLSMEDLLLFSLTLLRENPETAQNFSKEWDFWLIDEYQDTSWIQEQIVEKITGFKNVFCVGDPSQSIYLFRGADPHVFKRREQAQTASVKKLEANYRSSASLIDFFNDFFSEDKGFMKFKPPEGRPALLDRPSVYFLTYSPPAKQKGADRTHVLTALYYHIQKLKREGTAYGDIAVLSSKNDDLAEISAHLRGCSLPLALHSSYNFAQNRLVLDSLFLLKFLINPYDDVNLKALLRTPYFHLSDQELADSSYEFLEKRKKKESGYFWLFIQNKFSDRLFIKSLSSYLSDKEECGLVKGFERALMGAGLMDLAHFQDPTGASFANLWKLLYLLNKDSSSPLELFYSLFLEEDADRNKEAPVSGNSSAVQLMTIHKSKGLEFEHVIVLDFSIARSSLRQGDPKKDSIISDGKKMAFSVPMGGRDSAKVKSYAHKIYNKKQAWERLLEKERLLYVAMTRAKQSLTLFIPNMPPQKNSWLSEVKFFKEFSVSEGKAPLLEERLDEKDQTKIKSWRLNEGLYKTKSCLFCVQSSESICQAPDQWISSGPAEQKPENASYSHKKIAVTGGEEHFKEDFRLRAESFSHFLSAAEDTAGEKAKEPEEFNITRAKNTLFKANLGNHLHIFLQKLSRRPLEQIQPLIKNIFLTPEEQKQIKQALAYISELKDPDMRRFLKTGFSEWPFQVKKGKALFQGRVDLWAWDHNQKHIHLFDYKSSPSQPDRTKKQLIFYSGILNQIYHPEKIWMYEVYPFQKTIRPALYNSSHQSLFESWLDKIAR